MNTCIFCNREIKNKGSLRAHENVCHLNPNKTKYKRSPNAGRKRGSIAWNKGKTNTELYGEERALKISKLASNSIKANIKNTGTSWAKMSDKQKQKFIESHRKYITNRYNSGWMPKAGRCKKINYTSQYAGNVKLDGSWELALAVYLDKNQIEWRRNTERFEYLNEFGKKSFYTPDFYIKNYDIFIEVKGYETLKDQCKWRDFNKKLNIFKFHELKMIENNIHFHTILKESKSVRN
jgi:hypothetical protein